VTLKTKYIGELQANFKDAIQESAQTLSQDRSDSQAQIFKHLLDNITQENQKSKRVIEELQRREIQCQRKWNKLI